MTKIKTGGRAMPKPKFQYTGPFYYSPLFTKEGREKVFGNIVDLIGETAIQGVTRNESVWILEAFNAYAAMRRTRRKK